MRRRRRIPLPTPFRDINRIWGQPLVPSVYGPLWVAYDRAMVSRAPTIADGVFRIRVGNVLALVAIAATWWFLRVPAAIIWLFAINPMVWNNFVLSGHNDVVPILLTCVAILAVERGWALLAVLFVAAAGLSKITFALIALIAFAHANGHPLHPIGTVLHVVFATLAVLAVACALFRGVWIAASTWSFASLSAFYFSWYVAWGLPFALASRRYLAPFLISLPVFGTLIFAPVTPLLGAPTIALICIVLAVVQIRYGAKARCDLTRAA